MTGLENTLFSIFAINESRNKSRLSRHLNLRFEFPCSDTKVETGVKAKKSIIKHFCDSKQESVFDGLSGNEAPDKCLLE